MIDEEEVLARFVDIRRETMYRWIERGWITPDQNGSRFRFREIDIARLRLIREFRSDLELDADALDVILPLLDQVHGLRAQVRRLAAAVDKEPDDVRRRIARTLSEDTG
jgi:chaperone modulatory protein CbpM